MAKLIALSARAMMVAVLALLAASFAALFWGVRKTYSAISAIFDETPTVAFYLIQMVDAFLIAIVLYVFAASIYELFIGKLDIPAWIPAHNLTELKTKLSSLVVLVFAIEFLGQLLKPAYKGASDYVDSSELLNRALAISLVSMTLIVFMRWSDKPDKYEQSAAENERNSE